MRMKRPSTPLSRSRVRRSAGTYRRTLRAEMIAAYGSECSCCYEKVSAFLTLEHTRQDGAEHRRAVGENGQAQLLDLKTRGWPKDGYTLLCFNCNLASYHNGGRCPHEDIRCYSQSATTSGSSGASRAAGERATR